MLLIDTYDSLGSGIENAIAVGRRLKKNGHRVGVRLDSGDLDYLSREVRRKLDEAGLQDAFIVASNELDERIIHQLVTEGAPIDSWGVGTRLVTADGDPAASGVYKLAAKKSGESFLPVMKLSNNPLKATLPGIKQVHRFYDSSGSPLADLITLAEEEPPAQGPVTFHHPFIDHARFSLREFHHSEPLLTRKMTNGRRDSSPPPLALGV